MLLFYPVWQSVPFIGVFRPFTFNVTLHLNLSSFCVMSILCFFIPCLLLDRINFKIFFLKFTLLALVMPLHFIVSVVPLRFQQTSSTYHSPPPQVISLQLWCESYSDMLPFSFFFFVLLFLCFLILYMFLTQQCTGNLALNRGQYNWEPKAMQNENL